MPVLRLNHFSITTSDIERSLAFWRDLLELEVIARGEIAAPHLDQIIGLGPVRLAWAELAIPGGGTLEIFEYLEPPGTSVRPRTCDPGSVHVCFEATELDALVERLRAAGFPARSPEPVTIPTGNWRGWRDIYVEDPDGVTIELSERPPAAAVVSGAV
jgi:catechol 2,3-dioxygenase-like lactoylglutathione lyase family enzyme